MALVQCKECQANISNSAEACPQCGASRRGLGFRGFRRAILALWGIFVFMAAAVILSTTYGSITPEASAIQVSQLYDGANMGLLALIAVTLGLSMLS